jgi:O-antigen/teichoic acid export membrane protein
MDEKSQISRGFMWLGAASTITAIIDGVSSFVVVWFLTREQMGVATLAWAVAVLLEAFNGLGIGMALIQIKKLTTRQLGFCHSYAIAFAVLSTGGMCLAAPLIASGYGLPELTPMIRVSALKLLFVGACLVPLQSLNRNLDFPKVSIIVTSATLLAACTRIGLAAAGAGAWAPVIGNTSHGAFVLLGTLILSRHWPRPTWAWRESRSLVTFGLKLTSSGALYQFYRNIDFYLVPPFLGIEALGLYRVAYDLAMVPAMMILTVVNRASFPVYSRIASDLPRLAKTFTWNMRNLSLLILPLCLFIGFAGPSILSVFGKTNQWAGAGSAVYILSLAAGLRCIDQFFPQMFAAVGRANYALIDAILSTIVFCGLVSFGLYFFGDELGIIIVCIAWVVGYLLLFIPLWLMTLRIMPFSLWRFTATVFKDSVKGTALMAFALGAATLLLHLLGAKPWAQLAVLLAVGLAVYVLWLRLDLKVSLKSLLRSTKSGPDDKGMIGDAPP